MRKNRLALIIVAGVLLLSMAALLFYKNFNLSALETDQTTVGCSISGDPASYYAYGYNRDNSEVFQTFVARRLQVSSVSIYAPQEQSDYNMRAEISEYSGNTYKPTLGSSSITVTAGSSVPRVTFNFSPVVNVTIGTTYKIVFLKTSGNNETIWIIDSGRTADNACFNDGIFLFKQNGIIVPKPAFDFVFNLVESGLPAGVTPVTPPVNPPVVPGKTVVPTPKPRTSPTVRPVTPTVRTSPTVRPVTPIPGVIVTYEPTYEPTEEPTFEPTIEPTATPEVTEGGIKPIYIIIGILLLLLIAYVVYKLYKNKDDGQPPAGYQDEAPIVPPSDQNNEENQGQVGMTGELIPNAPEGLMAPPSGQQAQDQAMAVPVPMPVTDSQEEAPQQVAPVPPTPPLPPAPGQDQQAAANQAPQNPNLQTGVKELPDMEI